MDFATLGIALIFILVGLGLLVMTGSQTIIPPSIMQLFRGPLASSLFLKVEVSETKNPNTKEVAHIRSLGMRRIELVMDRPVNVGQSLRVYLGALPGVGRRDFAIDGEVTVSKRIGHSQTQSIVLKLKEPGKLHSSHLPAYIQHLARQTRVTFFS